MSSTVSYKEWTAAKNVQSDTGSTTVLLENGSQIRKIPDTVISRLIPDGKGSRSRSCSRHKCKALNIDQCAPVLPWVFSLSGGDINGYDKTKREARTYINHNTYTLCSRL
jgi:hypothetical protein